MKAAKHRAVLGPDKSALDCYTPIVCALTFHSADMDSRRVRHLPASVFLLEPIDLACCFALAPVADGTSPIPMCDRPDFAAQPM